MEAAQLSHLDNMMQSRMQKVESITNTRENVKNTRAPTIPHWQTKWHCNKNLTEWLKEWLGDTLNDDECTDCTHSLLFQLSRRSARMLVKPATKAKHQASSKNGMQLSMMHARLQLESEHKQKRKLHAHCMQRQARHRLVAAACKEQRGIPV